MKTSGSGKRAMFSKAALHSEQFAIAAFEAQMRHYLGHVPHAGRRGNRTWSRPHQGDREIARRIRQTMAGKITASNGMVPVMSEEGRRLLSQFNNPR